ncbi:MAG: sigma-70 family RNA polymerase sigma factor [Planctomycetes bacterium]|nr:sigma-70 family RNA polymerase sigma factor [Planctomycetota bacterium]
MDFHSQTGSAAPLSTSTGLLEGAKGHDPESWRRLTHIYGPLVYRWIRQCGLQAGDAADVAQEVFCAVWTGLENFRKERPGDSFRAWLWTITRNKIRDYGRRRAASPPPPGGDDAQRRLEQIPEAPPDQSTAAPERGAAGEAIHRCVELVRAEFEPRTWQAFWQTAVEGRTGAEAAEDLGISVGAVYMAKSRVLRRLREELEGLVD